MKIAAISDLHGDLIDLCEDCEVVFICGDISPLAIQVNDRKMKKWLQEDFKPWCDQLPCDKVCFIAGNHDWIFSRNKEIRKLFPKDSKITYLFHEDTTYKSKDGREYRIFGTPYCRQFHNWAFMASDEELQRLYLEIPDNLDILLTHDQPYGYGDVILQNVYWNTGEHIGNKPLTEAVFSRQIKYMFCGHLHSTTHNLVEISNTKRYNVSIKDEYYNIVYKPLYLDI